MFVSIPWIYINVLEINELVIDDGIAELQASHSLELIKHWHGLLLLIYGSSKSTLTYLTYKNWWTVSHWTCVLQCETIVPFLCLQRFS